MLAITTFPVRLSSHLTTVRPPNEAHGRLVCLICMKQAKPGPSAP
jgi:hypothetical protein